MTIAARLNDSIDAFVPIARRSVVPQPLMDMMQMVMVVVMVVMVVMMVMQMMVMVLKVMELVTYVPMRWSSGSLVLARSLIVGFLVDDELVASHAVPPLVTSMRL